MYILSAEQIKAWDQYTIQHEPVSSIDLMERAAAGCVEWIEGQLLDQSFIIFCGKGNNGGDGLAIARMLIQKGYPVVVYILELGKPGSRDFEINRQRLQGGAVAIHFIKTEQDFPVLDSGVVLIDALFGSGLSKPLDGLAAALVGYINSFDLLTISIDFPSGLFMDESSIGNSIVRADHTLTFQCQKLGLLVQENAPFIGQVHILDIGLDPRYLTENKFDMELLEKSHIKKLFQPRDAFAHKGKFGHALVVAGHYGKMGAATLCVNACLHSGAGLTTAYIPKCGYTILQIAVPEVMVLTDSNEEHLSCLPGEIEKYSVIAIGPGIGTKDDTQKMLSFIIRRYTKPLVVDADGLNCISLQPPLLQQMPAGSIVTPHPKEFDRLFGEHQNDFARIKTARQKAQQLHIHIVLKGHHTLIATPAGYASFNSTGNAGMAKGGSGDVLTGIIAGLLAQEYQPEQAAILGVYLHGLAGDVAVASISEEALIATDIIQSLSKAFQMISMP